MKMMNMLLGMTFMYETLPSIHAEQWKDEIRVAYRASMNLPRKKKKQVRKKLQLDWSIACWEPKFTF